MKVLAFAGSNSTKSINKKLVTYAVNLLDNIETEILDLNNYNLPLFSEDKELELGKPQIAQDFFAKIGGSDAIVISLAEHNGTYSVAYKNLFDWCSRINPKVFQNKPIILLSTSPGAKGASSVLHSAVESMKYFGGNVKGSLSIPNFYDNFDIETNNLINNDIKLELNKVMNKLLEI